MAANTILLGDKYELVEHVASEAITPGHLCALHSSSGTKIKKHATAKGFTERLFAIEDPLQGKTASSVEARTIDTAYANAEKVKAALVMPGVPVLAWLKAGQNVVIGDLLQSAGDGTLQKNSGTADLQTVGVALEALNLSASGAVATRIRIRVS